MDKKDARFTQIYINERNSAYLGAVLKRRQPQAVLAPISPNEHQTKRKKESDYHTETRGVTYQPARTIASSTRSQASRADIIGAQLGDPWQKYIRILTWLDLGPETFLAMELSSPGKFVNVRAFRGSAAERSLHEIQKLRHRSFISALEAFSIREDVYVVFEAMQLNLLHIISCTRYPSPHEGAAIIGQGLVNKDEGTEGVHNKQWLPNADAVSFVATTTSAQSASELQPVLGLTFHFHVAVLTAGLARVSEELRTEGCIVGLWLFAGLDYD
ncbi:uncharacterized protein B0I36DRAFT_350485 [Microdochium trichocladiopsis]|uniref:Protein kinase domain-containing protein n=1 Tax=Microdochium trichocladiopsis TaxID=1682393 RepID=A0A9P8Y4M2_9PEZI|nr:uncharacterized protein B0I36DRAFT_350485 [Microdochium trichocladiopsis]KAH7029643.1 hypothetical protein B0I36DRAFT_350485 [Microdochium trichocladiopsis]